MRSWCRSGRSTSRRSSSTCVGDTPAGRASRSWSWRTGFETRVTILGHVQRGGTPLAFDRVLATRFGVTAMDAVDGGRFGTMVGLRGTEIVEVPLEEALLKPKLLDPTLYETAELFFG